MNQSNSQAGSQAFALSKSLLRQAFRTNLDRDDHDQALLKTNTESLCLRLTEFLKTQSGTWATFEPIGFEPDIRSVIQASSHIQWVYPRVAGDALEFYAVRSRDDLVPNQWKILEPNPATATLVPLSQISGLLVPGLAFDENCNRLGRGKGYYDRTLATNQNQNQELQKIGIALDRQLTSQSLPFDAHDIAMNRVITESRVISSPHERTSP